MNHHMTNNKPRRNMHEVLLAFETLLESSNEDPTVLLILLWNVAAASYECVDPFFNVVYLDQFADDDFLWLADTFVERT